MSGLNFVSIFVFLLLIIIAVAIPIAWALLRKPTPPRGPRCGRCEYNLTGAPGNRCPECGALFIEAGVLVADPSQSSTGRTAKGVMFVAFLSLGVLLGLAVLFGYVQTRAAMSRAVAARQAAAAAQLRAQNQASALTTQPATTRHSDPTP